MSTNPNNTATQSTKNVVVLGSSYAGLSTAHYLLRHTISSLPSTSSYKVFLVAPSAHTLCRPACPRAMLSDTFFDQEKLFVSIEDSLVQYIPGGVTFVQGAATHVDTKTREITIKKVSTNGDSEGEEIYLNYDALIIATGASTPSPLFGFNSGNRSTLTKHWAALRSALPTTKSIVIAGGGPTGIETAAELGEFLNGRPGYFTSKPAHPKTEITVVCASEQILPSLRPALAAKAEQMLARVGVKVVKGVRVVNVSPASAGASLESLTANAKVVLSDGSTIDADMYIPAMGTRPDTSFLPSDLLDSNQRVQTNPLTFRAYGQDCVYSIGDCSSAFSRPSIHNILFGAIPVLCDNLKKDLLEVEGVQSGMENRMFNEDLKENQLVPIGRSAGVGAMMGWAIPSWIVWAIKGRDYWLWTTGKLWSGKQWAKAA